jgi:hypothetical protein
MQVSIFFGVPEGIFLFSLAIVVAFISFSASFGLPSFCFHESPGNPAQAHHSSKLSS